MPKSLGSNNLAFFFFLIQFVQDQHKFTISATISLLGEELSYILFKNVLWLSFDALLRVFLGSFQSSYPMLSLFQTPKSVLQAAGHICTSRDPKILALPPSTLYLNQYLKRP